MRERGLKLTPKLEPEHSTLVAPVRERGLKFNKEIYAQGNTDGRSREGAWIEIAATGQYGTNGSSLP